LIVVTAAAVIVSNLAVAAWFELGNERLSESELNERIVERAASTATLLAAIPARARGEAAAAMSTGFWTFSLRSGKPAPATMNDSEMKLAARLRAMLPLEKSLLPISVHTATMQPPDIGKRHGQRSPT